MIMNDLIIDVQNVSKEYRLGTIGSTTLKEDLQRKIAKLFGKEDPTIRIGETTYNNGSHFLALNDVSFSVREGETIGIIGHNGAGKSTLLKLITRVTSPTEGCICLNGRVASLLEVGTGFHPELTGRENIYINGAILGMKKKEIDKRVDEIIAFSECEQFIDTPVKRYSSGMYVKLAFSVAAHLNSEILIMDEVLAVGDVSFQNKCIQKMIEVSESGKTILYVSHNMSTIRALCKRCIVLSHGSLMYDGNVEDAISTYIQSTFNTNCRSDLSDKKRKKSLSLYAKANVLEVLERESTLFSMDDTIRFRIDWTMNRQLEDLSLRMIISTVNDNAVGVCFSHAFPGRIGENQTVFQYKIPNLLPGKYKMDISLMQLDQNGRFVKHDEIKEALYFEIDISTNKLVYNYKYPDWGSIDLGEIQVIG